ncbi:MAG: TraR/DksA family transcriptional regulator [Saprospiraceae bacterium]|nr:TraR/DksA family transcriptional regulator [Saprospiraceae bacterium]
MVFNATEKEFIEDKLHQKIKRAIDKIERMKDMTQPITPENSIGRVSRMDAINNKSVMEAALRTAQEELDAMQSALRRLSTDESFGLCDRCGKPIPFQRIALMPGSTKCVHCA